MKINIFIGKPGVGKTTLVFACFDKNKIIKISSDRPKRKNKNDNIKHVKTRTFKLFKFFYIGLSKKDKYYYGLSILEFLKHIFKTEVAIVLDLDNLNKILEMFLNNKKMLKYIKINIFLIKANKSIIKERLFIEKDIKRLNRKDFSHNFSKKVQQIKEKVKQLDNIHFFTINNNKKIEIAKQNIVKIKDK